MAVGAGEIKPYMMDVKDILRRGELLTDVDYSPVDAILTKQRKESRQWLSDALEGKKENRKLSAGAKLRSFIGLQRACAEYDFRNRIKPLAKRILRR